MGTRPTADTAVSPVGHNGRPHRRRRRLIIGLVCIALAIVVLVAGILLAVAWYFSSQLLDVRSDRASYDLKVLALHTTYIELPRTGSTQRNGVFAIDWPTGRVTLGPILSSSRTTVVRRFSGSTDGLAPGLKVDFDIPVYASPAGFGATYRTVQVAGPLGRMPAWYIPGRRTVWAILVHGYKANRTDPLRAAPTLIGLGMPVLDLSYRNDAGDPPSPDHLYHLGASEWQDLQAGVEYALAHGARQVVLYGYSMGGGIVETFLHRSRYAGSVRAAVLDAPALDWNATIDLAARNRGLPHFLAALTERVIAWRIGLSSLDEINGVKAAASTRIPTLIFHGRDDTLVPISTSIALAHARPDLVTFYPVAGAGHTESWNVDPSLYNKRLNAFLHRVLEP